MDALHLAAIAAAVVFDSAVEPPCYDFGVSESVVAVDVFVDCAAPSDFSPLPADAESDDSEHVDFLAFEHRSAVVDLAASAHFAGTDVAELFPVLVLRNCYSDAFGWSCAHVRCASGALSVPAAVLGTVDGADSIHVDGTDQVAALVVAELAAASAAELAVAASFADSSAAVAALVGSIAYALDAAEIADALDAVAEIAVDASAVDVSSVVAQLDVAASVAALAASSSAVVASASAVSAFASAASASADFAPLSPDVFASSLRAPADELLLSQTPPSYDDVLLPSASRVSAATPAHVRSAVFY